MWAWLGKIPFVKKLAYRKVFDPQGVYSAIVLDDLRRICGGTGSLWRGDTNETLRMTARNEVFCHIRSNINITDADISKLYADTLENLND